MYDDHGDIGAWTFKKLGPWNVRLEWSNKARKCVLITRGVAPN